MDGIMRYLNAVKQPLQKLRTNLLCNRAVAVLGPMLYSRYLAAFVAKLPAIVAAGDLLPLDRTMGRSARHFRYRGREVVFDCPFCDDHIKDGTYAFGVVREIYIRDCYI